MTFPNHRALLFVFALSAAGGSSAAAEETAAQPATGQCSIQLTYVGCRACCDAYDDLSGLLEPLCDAALTGGGTLVGGWIGGVAGRLAGDLVCEPMMRDAQCYDRCIGKDGDPAPIECSDPGAPEEHGVCRQVCEQGQHNIGPAGCPQTPSFDLTCCVNEYDPPEDDCPAGLCPGPACPAGCDGVLR